MTGSTINLDVYLVSSATRSITVLWSFHNLFSCFVQEVLPGVLDGKIIRCMRIINPDQDEYPGLVQVGKEEDEGNNSNELIHMNINVI